MGPEPPGMVATHGQSLPSYIAHLLEHSSVFAEFTHLLILLVSWEYGPRAFHQGPDSADFLGALPCMGHFFPALLDTIVELPEVTSAR